MTDTTSKTIDSDPANLPNQEGVIIPGQDSQIPAGGQGDTALLSDPHRAQSDCKMVGRAMRERWPTTAQIKAKIVSRAEACVDDPLIDPDTFCSVGRLVLGMEAQNQADDHLEDKNSRLDSGKATENVSHAVIVTGIDPEAL